MKVKYLRAAKDTLVIMFGDPNHVTAEENRVIDEAEQSGHQWYLNTTIKGALKFVEKHTGIKASTLKNRIARMSWQEAIDMGASDQHRKTHPWLGSNSRRR